MNPSDVAAAYVVSIVREQHPNMHVRTCPSLHVVGRLFPDKVVGTTWCQHDEPEEFEFATDVLSLITGGA